MKHFTLKNNCVCQEKLIWILKEKKYNNETNLQKQMSLIALKAVLYMQNGQLNNIVKHVLRNQLRWNWKGELV